MTWNPRWSAGLCVGCLVCACEMPDRDQKGVKATPTTSRDATETLVPTPAVAPSSGGANGESKVDTLTCNRLPFFDFYRNARLITLDEPNSVRLQIHINYHTGAGCMAPDGYGTDLIIALRLRAEDSGCFLETAEVRAVDWGLPESLADASGRKLRFDFIPFDILQRVDLARLDATAVVVHNAHHALSAMIRRNGVLWYEQTRRDSILHTNVDTQGEEKGCCWPATSTYYREHGVYD